MLQLGLACGAAAQDAALPEDTLAHATVPQDPNAGPYFYRGLPYGSEAYMGPLDVLLNKGFALAQTETLSRKVFEYPYGLDHVVDALAHPLKAIERGGGAWDFVRKELLPLSYDPNDVKWFTNYFGHIIEGGIHWRRLAEWYEARGVPFPGLMSGINNMAAAVLNEMYEHPGSSSGSAATVADLYFFDIAGILLFSRDGVSRFFARTLHANIWPGQASLTYPEGELKNTANRLFFKLPVSVVPNSSIFFWTGIGAQAGLTFHRSDGLDVSVAAGVDAKRMRVDPVTGEETADLALSAGVFVDLNGSLMADIHISQLYDRLLTVNVYPGVIGLGGRSFGAWLILTRGLEPSIGITNRHWLGLGVGVSR